MQIIDKTGEESEERFLLEHNPLALVHVGQHEDKDRQGLGKVMYFCLVVVDARSIPMVLDGVDYSSVTVHPGPGRHTQTLRQPHT